MSSSQSPSEGGAPPSFDDETPESKGSIPVTNRNSWIYTPVSLPSSNTKAKPSTDVPGFHQTAMARIDTALDVLGEFDFVDAVQLLREKNQLSCEEAMRQLYNYFYSKDQKSSQDRTTWSQHRQTRPTTEASTSTSEAPSHQQPLQLRGRSPDTVWTQSKEATINHQVPLSTSSQFDTGYSQSSNKGQHLPGQSSLPNLPTEGTGLFTRPLRGATFSTACKSDGTAIDHRFASRLNLYGGGSVGGAHARLENESAEQAPYNPTATTFTPTGSRQVLSRSSNNNFIGFGSVPCTMDSSFGSYGNLNPMVGQQLEWLGKSSKSKSPNTGDNERQDDSGLGLTPPSAENDRSVSRMPVPVQLNQGGTEERRFIPMNAAVKQSGYTPQSPAHYFTQHSPSIKFSERYLGQHTESNASANIPEDYNCAVWIRNLPPDVTYAELLGSIQQIGRVWCSYINVPDYVKHHTAAAKVVFYRPESARALLEFVFKQNPNIRGHFFTADLNRIKSAPHSLSDGTSRVLIVTGEDWFANETYLREWFAQQCQFQLDQTVTHIKVHGRAVIEFRFGSYRSQAEAGFKALTINRPKGFEKVEFGDDPCEVGQTLTSRSIALQRFQGIGI